MTMLFRMLCSASILYLSACNDVPSGPAPTPAKAQINLSQHSDSRALAKAAYQHTETILNFGHRQPQSPGLAKTKTYLKSELAKTGWQAVEQHFESSTPKGKIAFSNIIARYAPKQGSNPWNRSTKGLLTCHIDSKILPNFLGADDAASSAGAILALAQHLHQNHPKAAHALELVFFDGEEAIAPNIVYGKDGLYGSIHYAKALRINHAQGVAPYKKKPHFGILLDMIGHKNLRVAIPSDTPRSLADSYTSAHKKLGYSTAFTYHNSPILDDHVPLNEIAQIPTIDLIGDFSAHKWWHTTADNLDLISQKSLQMSIEMTLEILSNHL